MPWKIQANHPDCPTSKPWGVVVIATGRKVGCHATKSDAQAHVAALNANAKGSPMRETRIMRNVEVRAFTDDQGRPGVTLQPIVPGVVDDYGSVWDAHTFDAYAEKRLPVLCWSHDWADPLGPGLDYIPGGDGPTARFLFSDFDAVPQAKRAHAQVSDGTIVDCSVGFSNTKRRDPTDDEIAKWPGVKEIIFEAELDEVSLVLRGAVPGAKALALRSAGHGKREVPEEFVIDLAKKVKAGHITKEEAKTALDLVADQGQPAGENGGGGGDDDPEPSPSAGEAEAEADAALAALEDA